jgi:hypothetical protein
LSPLPEPVQEYGSVGDIQTQQSAKTMAFDQKSKRLFLSEAVMEPAPVAI